MGVPRLLQGLPIRVPYHSGREAGYSRVPKNQT
jgi:hypothetical protein